MPFMPKKAIQLYKHTFQSIQLYKHTFQRQECVSLVNLQCSIK